MTTPYKNQNGNIIGSDQALLDNREFSWINVQDQLFKSADTVVYTKATMGGHGNDYGFYSSAVYNGILYLGTGNGNAATDSTAAKVITYDGTTWSVITKATMGGVNADDILLSMAIYDGKLYIGTHNTTAATDSTGAKLLVYDGTSWSIVTKATMGADANDFGFTSMNVYGNKLYIGTNNTTAATDSTAAKVITYDGASWSVIDKATMGGVAADTNMFSMAVYNGKLYIGTYNTTAATNTTAAKLLVYDGAVWSVITKATMAAHSNDTILYAMAVHCGNLYVGTNNSTAASDTTAAKLCRYNTKRWSYITKATMGLATASYIFQSMCVYNGRLFVGLYNTTAATGATGAFIFIFHDVVNTGYETVWKILKTHFSGTNDDVGFDTMIVYQGKLYIATNNATVATDTTASKIFALQIPIFEISNSFTSRGF